MSGSATVVGGPADYPASGVVAGASTVAGAVTSDQAAAGAVAVVSGVDGAVTLVEGPQDWAVSGTVAAESQVAGAVSGGSGLGPAPPHRTLVVPAEARRLIIPPEDRTLIVEAS